MAKRPGSTIPQYKRKRRRGGWLNPKIPVERQGWRAIPAWIIGVILRLVILFIILSLLWVIAYRFINPPITATMFGDMIAGRGATREWMPIEQMDRDMVRAAIGAEDSKFCSHNGFDLQAIEAAAKRNASGGRIRGGSTISQQTAKNAFLWQGGGYVRKGMEAWFTLLMEQFWDKRRIMEVYLNVAETGIGTYGVNAGSQRYFDHDASAMSRTEAARIAAVLPLPKERGAKTPKGFTRRYGNSIAARIRVVARDGLDECVYRDMLPPKEKAPPSSRAPRTLPGEEYESSEPLPPLEEVVEELPQATDAPLTTDEPSDLAPEESAADAPGSEAPLDEPVAAEPVDTPDTPVMSPPQ